MLVDIEYSSRKNNHLKRLIKNAGFDYPEASIGDINYTLGHRLNKELIMDLLSANIYMNTEIYLLLVLQDAVRLTWFALWAWKHVRSITIQYNTRILNE